jgi:hypothetical protein
MRGSKKYHISRLKYRSDEMEILFDDKYNGPRWTYGLKYRSVSYGNVPAGWIVFSNREHPDFYFGTIDYPFDLEELADSMELTLVGVSEPS